MPSYKNTSDRTILGIEPGQTGELDDASGFVGPGALEEVGNYGSDDFKKVRREHLESEAVEVPEGAPVSLPKPIRGPVVTDSGDNQ